MGSLTAALATVLLVTAWTALASAQVEVLAPATVEKLDPAKEKPLQLSPTGDIARLVSGDGEWEEAAPPLILDLDRDGVRDFVVLSMLDAQNLRRAIIIHDWGDAPDVFGNAVFYLILDAQDNVVEWAGTHRLRPRPGSGEGEPAPATGARPP